MDKKITLFHVDDDKLDIDHAKKIIAGFPEIEYLGSSRESQNCVAHINKIAPDILLLDIEMPEVSGFEVARQIERPTTQIVFLTSYTEFALSAFDYFALHYLLKPLSSEAFGDLLQRYKSLQHQKAQTQTNQIKDILEISNHADKFPTRVFINTQKELFVLPLESVAFIEAKGSYTQFNLIDGTHVTSSKLIKSYADIVQRNPDFLRIHRSYILNKRHVKSIQKTKTTVVIMFDNNLSFEIGKLNKDNWYNQLLS